MKREDLENAALQNVCACWFYDLGDMLGETDDETLKNVIEDSQYLHKQNQEQNPTSAVEYALEMANCPDTKYRQERRGK